MSRPATGIVVANRFELEELAGQGGMGSVYRARDRETGQLVALKMIHRGIAGPALLERFGREASLLAELRHPRIVAYVSHGQTVDGQLYLAMEWIAGISLATRLMQGLLTVGESLLLLGGLCEGLEVAHERGVVHRDLKPNNLLLRDGRIDQVVLIDFGIARQLLGGETITRTGALVGTPQYMAPEQVRGERVGPQADVFILGAVLYSCLTGQFPFAAPQLSEVMGAILYRDPEPLRRLRPDVPEALAALVERMLAKDVERRPRDASALRAEWAALGPVEPSPVSGEGPLDALARTQIAVPGQFPSSHEQVLISVVIALLGTTHIDEQDTLDQMQCRELEGQRGELQDELQSLGAHMTWAPTGALMLTFQHAGNATDQACLAARCALVIRARWPEARLALSTGRGWFLRDTPTGEVVDRALALLGTIESEGTHELNVVRLDDLSAGLLASRFTIDRAGAVAILRGDERTAAPQRLLLGKPTACVGREQELSMLDALYAGCVDNSLASAALVTAESGIGKSRLRLEFLRRLHARSPETLVLLGSGEQIGAGSPFGILGQALRHLCGVRDGAPLEAQRAQLGERIGARVPAGERRRVVEFLGELCHVPFPPEESPPLRSARQDPRIMSEQIQRAFVDFLGAECDERPVLIVLEDLQWSDAPSFKLLDGALRELAERPLMILGLARPEIRDLFPKLWIGAGRHEIALQGLSRKACERLIHQVLGPVQIGDQTVERIVKQAAGNALFLEELIRAVAEGRGDALPSTVLAMLQARITHLDPEARRLLRAASIYGQTFWLGGLTALLNGPLGGLDLEGPLDQLVQGELIERRRTSRFPGETEYGFRHALMRDAVYGLLTEQDCAAWHLLAARYLETMGEQDPRVLAEHHQRGASLAAAALWYLRATEDALRSHDPEGALLQIERGLACQPEGPLRGELIQARSRAETYLFDWQKACDSAEEAMKLLAEGGRAWLHSLMTVLSTAGLLGQDDLFQRRFEQFLTVQPDSDSHLIYLQTAATMVSVCGLRGLAHQARRCFACIEALEPRIAAEDAPCQAWILLARAEYLRTFEPDPWRQYQALTSAARLLAQAGDVRSECVTSVICGQALGELGDVEQAEAHLRALLATVQRRYEKYFETHCKVHLAALLVQSEERWGEATALARELLGTAGLTEGFRLWSHALVAEVALGRGQLAEAEEHAWQAVAPPIKAPLRHLLATGVLMRTLLGQGRPAEACALAEQSLAWIEERGGAGYAEAPARLAIAEVFQATGDAPRARAVLERAFALVVRSARGIPEPAVRSRFLKLPQHQRLFSRSRDFEGPAEALLEQCPESPPAPGGSASIS